MKVMECPCCHKRFPSTSYFMYQHVKKCLEKNNIIVL